MAGNISNTTSDVDDGVLFEVDSNGLVVIIAIMLFLSLIQYQLTRYRLRTQWKTRGTYNIPLESITIGRKLGGGSFATVYSGKWKGMGVAVKRFHSTSISRVDVLKEVVLLKELRHPNCVLFIGATLDTSPICIVTELLSASLYDTIQMNADSPYSWPERLRILHGAALGMQYLHESGMLHRDLKSPNLLLDSNKICKVADFGMAIAPSAIRMNHSFLVKEAKRVTRKSQKQEDKVEDTLLTESSCDSELIDEDVPLLATLDHRKPLQLNTKQDTVGEKLPSKRKPYLASRVTASDANESFFASPKSPLASVRKSVSAYFAYDGVLAVAKAAAQAQDNVPGGTPMWCAPELLSGEMEATTKSDVYSFGIIAGEVANWSDPYPGISELSISYKVINEGIRPKIPEHCPNAIRDLVETCWHTDPKERPPFEQVAQVLEHARSTCQLEPKSSSSFNANIANMFPKGKSSSLDDPWKTSPVVLNPTLVHIPRQNSENRLLTGLPKVLLGAAKEYLEGGTDHILLCRGVVSKGSGKFLTSGSFGRGGFLGGAARRNSKVAPESNNVEPRAEEEQPSNRRKERRSSFVKLFQTQHRNEERSRHCWQVLDTGGFVAVRIIQFRSTTALATCSLQMLHRIASIAKLKHDHILPVLGVYKNDTDLCIVEPYLPMGSVKDHLTEDPEKLQWTFELQIDVLKQVVSALVYLHEQVNPVTGKPKPVVHKRLKSSNVILAKGDNVDFPIIEHPRSIVARVAETSMVDLYCVSDLGRQCNPTGLGAYQCDASSAPEVVLLDDYSPASDMYSFGILMWELMHGEAPFRHMSAIELARRVCAEKKRPPIQSGKLVECNATKEAEASYISIMERCWDGDVVNRPTAREVLENITRIAKN